MSHKVLVVDDHEGLRQRIRAALERDGIEVCGEAANGQEAIQKVSEHSPGVVILDILMPVMSGLQALPEIVQSSPYTKIVMFSVHDAEELRRQAFDLGAHAYVVKSAPLEQLLAEVRKLLAQIA